MIHIKRSTDKKFYVTLTGENGEPLSTSEMLSSKQKTWKNIRAQCIAFESLEMNVIDATFKKPVMYAFDPILNIYARLT